MTQVSDFLKRKCQLKDHIQVFQAVPQDVFVNQIQIQSFGFCVIMMCVISLKPCLSRRSVSVTVGALK